MKKVLLIIFGLWTCGAMADTINVNWLNPDGTTYDTTTCTVGGDLILPTAPTKRGHTFRGWAFYTPLEYIESTGTQYIDTGIVANNNTGILYDVIITDNIAGTMLFGCWGNTSSAGRFCVSRGATNYEFGFGLGDGNLGVNYIDTLPVLTPHTKYNIYIKNKAIYINQVLQYTLSGDLSGNETEIYLFKAQDRLKNRDGIPQKLYRARIYNGDAIIRDMIPVLDSNGVACMLDTVSGQFFYNAGTGSFTAGPVLSNQ